MTAPAVRRRAGGALALRLLAAASLGVSSYLHVVLAQGPPVAGGQVTLAGLFLAQAAVAALVAVWVLVRPGRPAWLAVAVVGVASLLALVLSVYVKIPAVGPFPALYEPAWYADKVLAAVTAALAAASALVALSAGSARRPLHR